jgi:hypothetical protein
LFVDEIQIILVAFIALAISVSDLSDTVVHALSCSDTYVFSVVFTGNENQFIGLTIKELVKSDDR